MKTLATLALHAWIFALATPAFAETPRQLYLLSFDAPSVVEAADSALLAKHQGPERRADMAALASSLRSAQDADLQRLQEHLGRALHTEFRYQYGINGAALWLTVQEAAQLRELPGVAALRPDGVEHVLTDSGPAFIGATAVWNGIDGLPGKRGEGVVVGIIDTGIAASHPAFADRSSDGYDHNNPRGRRFGFCAGGNGAARCNDKLIGIYDYTSEGSRDGSDIDGHGTHVASTAAGNPFTGEVTAPTTNLVVNLSGVAPRANLISYKACVDNEFNGFCPNSATIAALDQAIADGVDVINYSIGGPASNPWSSLNSATVMRSMLNARAAGIVVSVAAGNEGPVDASVWSPANAPWVLAVANSTHDRVFQTTLTDLSGATAPPQDVFDGASLSAGMNATARVVLGEARGSALCSTGTELDSPPSGISNPFAPNSLAGLIVVCDRGIQARVAKGFNVQAAGAVGMVLVNAEGDGELVVADGHFLPSVHLGYQSGQALKQWLRSNPEARGRISTTVSARSPGNADVMNVSSGRGPDMAGSGVAKPNLSAPGTAILAADFQSTQSRSLSGTSMAAPHVAGAAALLKSMHPGWRAEQIVSSLTMTAEPAAMRNSDFSVARFADAGAGRTQVQRAARAQLYLPLSRAQFEQGNPAAGGDPGALNLPELYLPQCRTRCSLQRTVEALSAGSWTVDAELPEGLSVTITPTQFSLAAGARQTLRLDFDASGGKALGQWLNGRIHLRPADPQGERMSLPVQLFSVPGTFPQQLNVRVAGERGTAELDLGAGSVALPGANYRLLGPAEAQSRTITLSADNDDTTEAFLVNAGTVNEFFDVSADAHALLVMLRGNAGANVDLYVGREASVDGVASKFETLCAQRGSAAEEQCVVTGVSAGRYWIRMHNPSNSSRGAQLEYAVLGAGESTVSGPARLGANSSLKLRLAYELGGSPGNTRQWAVLQVFGEFDASAPLAQLALRLDRDPAQPGRAQLLPAGTSEQFVLTGGGTLQGLFLDDPGDGQARQLTLTGGAALQFSVLGGAPLSGPAVGLLAGGDSPVLLSRVGAGELQIPPGSSARRLYLRVVNNSSQATAFSLMRNPEAASLLAGGTQPGMYYNPARSGHGLFLTRARDELQVAWYTYDAQGEPVFYLAAAENAFGTGQAGLRKQVRMALNQYSWNGRRARGQVAGTAELTSLGTDRFQWSWQLDQAGGSEPMELLASSACVDLAERSFDLSGLWFNPDLPGYGASIFGRPDLELQAVYLYDQQGLPRWLWSEASPLGAGSNSPLFQYSGFCPGCTFAPVSRVNVGSLSRNYASEPGSAGQWRVQANLAAPLSGSSWDVSGPLLTLTEPTVCR